MLSFGNTVYIELNLSLGNSSENFRNESMQFSRTRALVLCVVLFDATIHFTVLQQYGFVAIPGIYYHSYLLGSS